MLVDRGGFNVRFPSTYAEMSVLVYTALVLLIVGKA